MRDVLPAIAVLLVQQKEPRLLLRTPRLLVH